MVGSGRGGHAEVAGDGYAFSPPRHAGDMRVLHGAPSSVARAGTGRARRSSMKSLHLALLGTALLAAPALAQPAAQSAPPAASPAAPAPGGPAAGPMRPRGPAALFRRV